MQVTRKIPVGEYKQIIISAIMFEVNQENHVLPIRNL